jgi:hypothetical protein
MLVFTLSVLLVPLLALVWVRVVWQAAGVPGVTPWELLRRSGLVAGAGAVAWVALRAVGAVLLTAGHLVEALARRLERP